MSTSTPSSSPPGLSHPLAALLAEQHKLHQLQARLLTLNDRTRWEGEQVPIAPRAFASGEIIHTNEVRVHLGDGWWAELTAKQAAAFVGRKLERLQQQVQILQNQPFETTRHPLSHQAEPTLPSSSLPFLLQPPLQQRTPTGQLRSMRAQDGSNLLNDEGLPVIEILEPLDNNSSSSPSRPPIPIALPSRRSDEARKAELERILAEAEAEEQEDRAGDEKETLGHAGKTSEVDERAMKEARDQPSPSTSPEPRGTARSLKGEDGVNLLAEDGLPVVEIVEPVSQSSPIHSKTNSPSSSPNPSIPPLSPLSASAPASAILLPKDETRRRTAIQKLLDKAEEEERELERRERLGLSTYEEEAKIEEVEEEDLEEGELDGSGDDEPTSSGKGRADKDAGKRKKSVSWSETHQVKEFNKHDSIGSKSSLSSSTSPSSTIASPSNVNPVSFSSVVIDPSNPSASLSVPTDDDGILHEPLKQPASSPSSPAKPEPFKNPMRMAVVERQPPPPPTPSAKTKMGGAREGGTKAIKRGKGGGWVLPDELQALAEEVSKGVGRGEVKKKDSPSDAADKPAGAGSVSLSPPPSAPSPSDASPSTTQTDSTTRTSASTSPSNPSPLFAPSSSSSSSSSPSSTPPTLKAATSSSPPEPDPESDSDDDFELSDPEDGEEDSSMLDMDEQMTMREATVEYYRLRDVLKAKGGLSGAMNGGGGLEEQEYVPLDATVAPTFDSNPTLSIPSSSNGGSSTSSAFRSSLLTPAEAAAVSLPTLVPGGGAQNEFKNAIRVGKLENGKLVLGGGGGVDDDDDDAESESEGDEGEEGEMVAAGKEALMYGMVGGVVVKEEDLAAGGEELLRKLARGQDGGGGGGDAGQVTPTPAAAVRTDFYQSDTTVTVSIFEKGLIPADVRIEFKESEISLHIPSRDITLAPLSHPIEPSLCSFRVSPVKIELLLFKKKVGTRWSSVTPSLPTSSPIAALPLHTKKTAPQSQPFAQPIVSLPTTPTATSQQTSSEPSAAPPQPLPKVSRFKSERQAAVIASHPPPLPPAPAASSSSSVPAPPSLPSSRRALSDAVERAPLPPTSSRTSTAAPAFSAPVDGNGNAQSTGGGEEKPAKRVSRFKAERMNR